MSIRSGLVKRIISGMYEILPDGRIYVLVDADTQNRKDLFDHKLVAAALSDGIGTQNRSHFSLSRSSVCQQRTGYATFRFQQSSLGVCYRQKTN